MHPVVSAITPPWEAVLTSGERSLIYYFLVVAGLALLAMMLRTIAGLREVSSRYRPAIFAGVGVVSVAFISYVVLALKFDVGYTQSGTGAAATFTPTGNTIWAFAPRYMDWSITVPLLMIELIGVSAITGLLAQRVRAVGVVAAFLMIFTGFIGGVVVDDGSSFPALLVWGIISSIFFVILYALVIYVLVKSLPALPSAARPTYRNAAVLLLVIWFAYPIVFGLQGWVFGGAATTTEQIILSVADVIAKVGYGLLIHKVAKLRTAADVEAGLDVHPESIWTDEEKNSDAVTPPTAGAVRGAQQQPAVVGVVLE